MRNIHFDEQHILHELKHFLPSQTPLKDFIHHNSLHAFQHLKFYDGIFQASKIFGYQVTLQLGEYRKLYDLGRIKKNILDQIIIDRKGHNELAEWKANVLTKSYDECNTPRIGKLRAQWKQQHAFDIDSMVQPLLFRVLCSYLDQGISIWEFPINGKGFLSSLRQLEEDSYTSFFKGARARRLLLNEELTITGLLDLVVGDVDFFTQYLFDQQFSHRGWSGMVAALEAAPSTLLSPKEISLRDLVIFELLLEIDALDYYVGKNW